ncbi:MAG: chemotaxis protein CheW [Spirochaetaceae bacterium]|nr:chemotaxis protein CheW [Spirochaetaceae bacterium]
MENVITDNVLEQQEIKKESSIDFKMVTFSLAGKDYGVDIMKVKEISKAGKFTFVPNSAPYVRGVYNLRGDIISVIDLRIFFNQPAKQSGENDLESMIIVRLEDHVIGIIVDEIDKVVGISSESVQPPHPLFGDINIKYISGIAESNSRLYVILDVDAIFGTKSEEVVPKETLKSESLQDDAPSIESVPQAVSAAIPDPKDRSDRELGFIKETLVTFKQFYSSAINDNWIKSRYSQWFEERYNKDQSIQLTGIDDAENYLSSFYSPYTNMLWSEDYINQIAQFIPKVSSGNFNIWNPGCGKGYETYSIISMMKKFRPELNLKVHGSDKDLISVASAPGLLFNKNSVPDFYDEFMVESNSGLQFLSSIKDLIMFEFRDLENLEVFSRLDMVIIRDVLSFLKEDLQEKVLQVILENLKDDGILILGKNEILPDLNGWEDISENGISAYRKR